MEENNKLEFNDILFHEQRNINNKNIDRKKDNFMEVKFKVKEPENIFNKHKVNYISLNLEDKSNLIKFLPSFESSLLECKYFIEVTAIYDTILPMKNTILNLPVFIYHLKSDEKINNKIEKYGIKSYDNDKYTNSEKIYYKPTVEEKKIQITKITNG